MDGGMTRNEFLLQLLADILGIPVGKGSSQLLVCVIVRFVFVSL